MKAHRFTTPKLVKGPEPIVIPKGSNKEKEWAKKTWYITYQYDRKQVRVKGDLNRIKDHKEKAYQAEVLLQSIKDDLANGYNPHNPEAFLEQLTKQTITLADAVSNYLADLAQHARKNSVDSYTSKLRHLVEAYPNEQLKDVGSKEIETYIRGKIYNSQPDRMFSKGKWITEKSSTKWTGGTVKAAKGVFRAFYYWCVREQYITENPIKNIEQKKIRSTVRAKDTNIPYTDQDLPTIMQYLDANDPYTAFFCRFIYSTCLRPREISQLQVKDIDLDRKQITIHLDVMKTTSKTKADVINIEPNLFILLQKLNLSQYPSHYYIFSKDEVNIVGTEPIDPEKPYKRLVEQHLKKIKLTGKGYTLYSFKHTSNIRRFNAGWTLAEIMKANRHADLQSTLEYLKNITKTTDISDKEIPSI